MNDNSGLGVIPAWGELALCQGTNHVPRVAEVTRAGVADRGLG